MTAGISIHLMLTTCISLIIYDISIQAYNTSLHPILVNICPIFYNILIIDVNKSGNNKIRLLMRPIYL